MSGYAMTRRLGFVVALATLLAGPLVSWAGAQDGTARTFYFSVLDRDGNPVTDLTAAEIEVKEGGKTQQVTLQPAAAPLRIALVVADGGTGAYQAAATTLINRLLKTGAEFKIVGVAEQPETYTTYTNSVPELSAAVQRLTKRTARRMSAQVLEAISESIADVAADGKRPVIIVMRLGGEAPSPLRANVVRDALRESGARLHVISPLGATGMGVSRGRADSQGETDMSNAVVLNQVIDDGSRDSGGRHDTVAATTLLKTAEQLATELLSQYEASYTLPAGTKPSDRLQIQTKRRNVRVHAPTRIPN